MRGPSLFQGYLGDEAATRAVLRGGWLATGDLGHLDDENYLAITGRKKDIIITSGARAWPRPRWSSGCACIRWCTRRWWWVTTGPASVP